MLTHLNLKMEVLPDTYNVDDGFPYCHGKITIGDFWETFEISLNYWTINNYRDQWREGIERLKYYDTSCLAASVHHPRNSYPLINWWVLYKIESTLYIQNELIAHDDYKKYIGNKIFAPQTCYDFITSRSTDPGERPEDWPEHLPWNVSEWHIELPPEYTIKYDHNPFAKNDMIRAWARTHIPRKYGFDAQQEILYEKPPDILVFSDPYKTCDDRYWRMFRERERMGTLNRFMTEKTGP